MSNRENDLLVQDILEAARKISKYTEGFTYERFEDDEKTIDAVVRNFEIIGEASGRITREFRVRDAQIEWQQLKGLRNRLIHAYFGVDLQIIWSIVEEKIPLLISQLEKITK